MLATEMREVPKTIQATLLPLFKAANQNWMVKKKTELDGYDPIAENTTHFGGRTWKLPSFWIAFTVLEGATQAARRGKRVINRLTQL